MAHRLGRGDGSGDGGSIGSAVTFCALCGIGSGVSNVSSVQICGDTSQSTCVPPDYHDSHLPTPHACNRNQPTAFGMCHTRTHMRIHTYTSTRIHKHARARTRGRTHARTQNNSGQRTREVTERLGGVLVRFPGLRPCCYQHVHAKQVLHIRLFDRMLHCGVVVDRLGIRAHRCCKDGFNRSPKLRVDCRRIRVGKRAF